MSPFLTPIFALVVTFCFPCFAQTGKNSTSRSTPDGVTYTVMFQSNRVENGKIILMGKGRLITFDSEIGFVEGGLVSSNKLVTKAKATVSFVKYSLNKSANDPESMRTAIILEASKPEESIEMVVTASGTRPISFTPGAEYTFVGELLINGFHIVSSKNEPLILRITNTKIGYDYVGGKGSIGKAGKPIDVYGSIGKEKEQPTQVQATTVVSTNSPNSLPKP